MTAQIIPFPQRGVHQEEPETQEDSLREQMRALDKVIAASKESKEALSRFMGDIEYSLYMADLYVGAINARLQLLRHKKGGLK